MEIRIFRSFLLVAKLLNFTQAAEKLNFTQPAITSQIHVLEENFGVRLFDRSGKKLCLTVAGERMVNYAEKMLSLYDSMQEAMATFQKDGGSLTVGIATQMINHKVPVILRELQHRQPGVNVSMAVRMNTQEVLKGILNNEFDLGFIHGKNSYLQLVQYSVWREPVIWVASPELLQQYNHSPNIMDYPIINYNVGSVFRAKMDEALQHSRLNCSIECSDSQAVRMAVLAGLGVSCVPKVLVKDNLQNKTLVQIKEAPVLELHVSVVYRKNKELSLAALNMLEILAELPDADRSLGPVEAARMDKGGFERYGAGS